MNRSNKDVSKFRLYGQAALISGSTRGIGWAIARGMAESVSQYMLMVVIKRSWQLDVKVLSN